MNRFRVVKHKRLLFHAFLVFRSLLSSMAWSMDSTEPLPARVNSPAFRYGIISGVDSKFNASGAVENLSDLSTVRFDSGQLKKLSPDMETLVLVLNQLSGTHRLGDQLNLGTLRIETDPDVKYFVPIFARGVTDNLSLGVALPIVFYKNSLRLVQSQSNANEICDQIGATPAPELAAACNKLRNTRMTDEVRAEMARKGFRRLEDRSETLIGDLQLVSFWRFFNREDSSAVLKTTLGLPTGKSDDPDDLADLGSFGQRSVENLLLYNYLPWKRLRLAARANYRLVLPDRVDARVPGAPDEVLPGPATRERVRRNIGDSGLLGAAATWTLIGDFSVAGGYEYAMKGEDRYSGDRGSRYDLLARNTGSTAHRLRGGLSYDTIGLYQRTRSFPPIKVDLEVSNTIAGRNSERQLVNEVNLMFFF